MSSTSASLPIYAFPPTTDAVVTDWYEVAATYDTRADLPRTMAVAAADAEGNLIGFATANCVELMQPDGTPLPLHVGDELLRFDFPCRWRINKPATTHRYTFIVWGLGITNTVQD